MKQQTSPKCQNKSHQSRRTCHDNINPKARSMTWIKKASKKTQVKKAWQHVRMTVWGETANGKSEMRAGKHTLLTGSPPPNMVKGHQSIMQQPNLDPDRLTPKTESVCSSAMTPKQKKPCGKKKKTHAIKTKHFKTRMPNNLKHIRSEKKEPQLFM